MNIVSFAHEMDRSSLPFRVRPVQATREMQEVLALREIAYSRHDYNDELKNSLGTPDEADRSGASTTFVAVDKVSSKVLGTVRIQCNVDFRPEFPPDMPDDPCLSGVFSYIDRFAILADTEHAKLVAAALMKAVWLWSLGRDARWLVALAMAPLARHYRRYGGLTIRGEGRPIPMPEYHTKPYFLVGAQLGEALQNLIQGNPSFAKDFIMKVHPDIHVAGTSASWEPLAARGYIALAG